MSLLKALLVLCNAVTWTSALVCVPDADGRVDLSNGKLGGVTSLTADTFTDCSSNITNITSLELSYNYIVQVDNDSFVQFFNLKYLSLSHNNISALNTSTFNALRGLERLDLSYNELTELRAGLIDNYHLNSVWFNNNNISYVEPGIVNSINHELQYFNMNYNKLKHLDPWPYLTYRAYSKLIDRVFYIQYNEIEELTNHMNWTFDLKYPFEIEVNCQYNKLFTITPDILRQYDPDLKDDSAMAMLLTFGMNLTHNEYFCDCELYTLAYALRDSILRYSRVDEFRYRCASPAAQAGWDFLHDLSLDELVCNRTEADNCPAGCFCQDRPHNDTFLVDCRNSPVYMTEMPAVLPENSRSKIEMYLDNKGISSLRQASYIPKLYTLSMRNNRLSSLDASIFGNMTLNYGDFRYNQLKSIPKEVKKTEKVLLTGNPLECDCNIMWIREWMEIDSDNADPELTCLKKDDEHKIMGLELRDIGCTNELVIIICIVLGVILAIVIVVIIFVKRCPYESSVILHKFSGLHPFHNWKGDKDKDKSIDLYLVYDDCDPEVIGYIRYFTHTLNKKKPCYSIFNPARFMEPGSQMENIYKYIGKSRRVVVFLSKGIFDNDLRMDEINDAEHRQVEAITQENVNNNTEDIRINIDDNDNASVNTENSQNLAPISGSNDTKNAPKIIYILYNEDVDAKVKEEPWKSRIASKTVLRPDPDDKLFWAKLRYELPQNGQGVGDGTYMPFGGTDGNTASENVRTDLRPRNNTDAPRERSVSPPKNPKLNYTTKKGVNTNKRMNIFSVVSNVTANKYQSDTGRNGGGSAHRPSRGSIAMPSCSGTSTSTRMDTKPGKISQQLNKLLKGKDGQQSDRLHVFGHNDNGREDGKLFFSRTMRQQTN